MVYTVAALATPRPDICPVEICRISESWTSRKEAVTIAPPFLAACPELPKMSVVSFD
jgi:hypothetical protein